MKRNAVKMFDRHSFFSGILPLFMLAHFGHHVVGALLIPLMPMIRSDLALNYTQSGVVLSAFAITGGISQLPAGWLADRIGTRIMVVAGISGVALAGVLVGLSQTYLMLIVLLVLMAVMGGGYHPASATAISASVPPQNRGQALGLHMIGGAASNLVAPLLAAAIAVIWDWRGAYITLAVPTIILGIALYVLLGRRAGMKKDKSQTAGEARASTGDAAYAESPLAPGHLRNLTLFLFMSVSIGALIFSVKSFIPLYLVDHFKVEEGTAAALMALIPLAGLWAAPLGGYLSDRIGRIRVILALGLLAGPVIYLFNLVPYGLAFGAILVIMGMISYVRVPTSESYIISHASSRRRSTMLGIYYFTNRETGGLLTPVMGYLIDRFGFYYSFTITGVVVMAITLICALWLWVSRD